MHNHAKYKADETGRFVIWKNLHFGCRGPAGSEYILEDTDPTAQIKRFLSFDRMSEVKCHILFKTKGLECAPYFGSDSGRWAAKDGNVKGHKLKLVSLPEWKEIKEG